MKQLKFFTSQVDTLKATQDELEKKGFTADKLHVFVKDNSHHSFDGLVLQSKHQEENSTVRWGTMMFVVLTFLAAFALFSQWISFLGFATIMGIYSLVPLFAKKEVRSKYADKYASNKTALKEVYFLIVDVNKGKEENVVARIAKHHSDLISQ